MSHIWVIEVSNDGGATWRFFATRGSRVDARDAASSVKHYGWSRARVVKFVVAS